MSKTFTGLGSFEPCGASPRLAPMRHIQCAIRIVCISLLLTASPSFAGWEEGQAAIDREQYAEALAHFKPLAEQGEARAQASVAAMYRYGLGVPKDAATALVWLRKAESQGHVSAIFRLGEMAEYGEGQPADIAVAVGYYRRAADLGHPRAQAVLGALHADGHGVAQDDGLAVQWYEKAAAQDDAMAQTNLGRMYKRGRGVTQDPKRAFALFEKAAQQGHARGQAELGIAYMDAIGVAEDGAAGVKWLRAAAEQESALGRFRLAWAYLEGNGVAADPAQAAGLFKQSAEQGLTAGMREYGRRLEFGEGVAADLAQARGWYERAAKEDDALSMYYLGTMYDEGNGITSDKAHAAYWYLRAARLDHAGALNDLGALYFNGEFVAKNMVLAHALFLRAKEAGDTNATGNLEKTQAALGSADRLAAQALSKQMANAKGMDEALSASLLAAQGRSAKAPDFHAVCLPMAPDPSAAQAEAWARDAHDRGFLWRIRKGEHSSYLYGTLHVVKMPWGLPGPRLMETLDAVDVVAVEADIQKMQETGNRLKLGSADTRPLDPALMERFNALAGPACAEVAKKTKASPLMLTTLITMREAAAQDLYITLAPDLLLPQVARNRKLKVEALEAPQRVFDTVESKLGGEFEASLQGMLKSPPEYRRRLLAGLASLWESGDFDRLETYESWCNCTKTEVDRRVLQGLNDDRNEGMAQAIDAIHSKGQRVLAAVGSFHMIGEKSLLKLLTAKGYSVERVPPLRPAGPTPSEIRVVQAPSGN